MTPVNTFPCDGPYGCVIFSPDITKSPIQNVISEFSKSTKSEDPDNCCQNDNFLYEITDHITDPIIAAPTNNPNLHDKANNLIFFEYPNTN